MRIFKCGKCLGHNIRIQYIWVHSIVHSSAHLEEYTLYYTKGKNGTLVCKKEHFDCKCSKCGYIWAEAIEGSSSEKDEHFMSADTVSTIKYCTCPSGTPYIRTGCRKRCTKCGLVVDDDE